MKGIQFVNDRMYGSVSYISSSFKLSEEEIQQALKEKRVRSCEVNGETHIDFNDFIKWMGKKKKNFPPEGTQS